VAAMVRGPQRRNGVLLGARALVAPVVVVAGVRAAIAGRCVVARRVESVPESTMTRRRRTWRRGGRSRSVGARGRRAGRRGCRGAAGRIGPDRPSGVDDRRRGLRETITRLTDDADRIREASAPLVAADAQAHDALSAGLELSAQLEAAGADFNDADALLAELGHGARPSSGRLRRSRST